MGISTSTFTAVALSAWSVVGSAAALAPSKTTDESVCDLAPATTVLLGRKTFISASYSPGEQAHGYRRLAAVFIADHCGPGQMLILQSQDSDEIDAQYLATLAVDLCKAADVVRTDTTATERFTNDRVFGYELRCRISKFEAFRKQLQVDETAESTTSLIGHLRNKPPTQTSAVQGSQPEAQSQSPKQDCSKLTLSALMFGGGGCR